MQSSLSAATSAYQKWELFGKVAEPWVSPSPSEISTISAGAAGQNFVNDIRTIFRTISSSAPEIRGHLTLKGLDPAMQSCGVRIMNGRHRIFSPAASFRKFGVYSMLKKYYQIVGDDKYVYDRNISIDVSDVVEILSHRVGIPAELVKKLPETSYGPLVNSYLSFSQELTQKLERTDDQLVCFLLMRSFVTARCAAEMKQST